MRKAVLLSTVVLLCAACGGAEEPKQTAPAPEFDTGNESSIGPGSSADTEGGESAADPAATPEPTEPQPTGPAKLTAKILVDNEEAPGDIKVMSASGGEVHSGSSGDTFTVQPGQYYLEASITDESVLADTPTRQGEPFTVSPAGERTETVELGRSLVKLKVLRGRRRIRRGLIELRRQGAEEVVVSTKISDDYIPISPGRYEATVKFGANEIEVSGLVFQGGAKQDIPVRVN